MPGWKSGEMTNTQCVLFLSDLASPRIMRHFDRLADEAPFPVFLCYAGGARPGRDGVRIDYEAAATRFRHRRPMGRLDRPRPFIPGTCDLLWLEAIATLAQTHTFDFYWTIEYDVEFSGHWSRFFNTFVNNPADLIATSIRHRRDDRAWRWWREFRPPPEVTEEHHVKAFFPLARFSARLVAGLGEIYDNSPCSGHQEAIIPTLCSYLGLDIEDIDATAPYGREGSGMAEVGSFDYKQDGMPTSYFHEEPSAFDAPNVLWHPVKVVDSRTMGALPAGR